MSNVYEKNKLWETSTISFQVRLAASSYPEFLQLARWTHGRQLLFQLDPSCVVMKEKKKQPRGIRNISVSSDARETYRKISTWTASFVWRKRWPIGRLRPSRKQWPLRERNGSTEATQAKWTGRAGGSVDRSASIGTDRQRDGPSSADRCASSSWSASPTSVPVVSSFRRCNARRRKTDRWPDTSLLLRPPAISTAATGE